MTEKKQIEEMAKILCGMKNGCDGCMFSKVYCNERNDAEEIYNAGYRKQSEWISVEERLPDTQQEVLTYSECNGVRSACLIVVKDDIKTWFLCTSNKLSISVTHWMPLPEPPKMKGGEE